jgi:hypothetical protein
MSKTLPLVAALSVLLSEPTLAASTQLLGESDFADGAIVSTDNEWLSAQSNENSPATGLYVDTLTYFHDVDPGPSAIITFSLWDLDSDLPGAQVTEFTLDNVPQPITAFETGAPDGSVEFFEFPVEGSAIADGMVQIAFAFAPSTHTVGIDFSRMEVAPEPSGALLLGISGAALWRRRKWSSGVAG